MKNEFIDSATKTIKTVASTMQERGGQYCDSWGDQGVWLLTKAVIKKYTDVDVSEDALKAIGLAVFVDQKYSRFLGGWKKDTAIDMVPYLAALVDKIKD